jgi:hypothetical protein
MERDQVFDSENGFAGVAMATILTKVSKKWETSQNAQQSNAVRMILCDAFKAGYTNPDIALEIRHYSFKNIPFDETSLAKDKLYLAISQRIRSIRKSYDNGLLNGLLGLEGRARQQAMKKKSPALDSRGRKMADNEKDLEEKLMAIIMKWIEDERRITRTMIFRQALEIDPLFMGGIESPDLMKRLRKWFYYGFVKRHKLSVRKIASVGQKLPADWKEKMVDMRGRVKHRQLPTQQTDGSIVLKGVSDAYYFNTDHVPVWYKSVGNYTWGLKNSGRCSVKTGGKEKERFTVQLGIGKGGTKLLPFLIFKGEEM